MEPEGSLPCSQKPTTGSISSTNSTYFTNVKVKLSVCLTKHRAKKTYGGAEV
jgi:hypothetical protein